MDREHATVFDTTPTAGADLIDFAEVKRRPRKPRPEPTPDELAERLTDQLTASIRRTMLKDLATWPTAFQRRVGEHIERQAQHAEWLRMEWHLFRTTRNANDADDTPAASCICGCRGFNGEIVERLRALRAAAATLRGGREEPERRSYVEWRKRELLVTLWYYGRRRIDRGRFRQHVADSARLECESIERGRLGDGMFSARKSVASAHRRLRAGVYEKGPHKGQRYTAEKRAAVEQELLHCRARVEGRRARLAELRAQLADEAALVRHWTGCERAPRAAAGVA